MANPMPMLRGITHALALIATQLLCSAQCEAVECKARLDVDQVGLARFDGCISSGDAEALVEQINSGKITKLVISSEGGDVISALRMVDAINAHEVSVEVVEECASSCANYILLLVDQVRVAANTTIFFHGRPWDSLRKSQLIGGVEPDESLHPEIIKIVKFERARVAMNSAAEYILNLATVLFMPYDYNYRFIDPRSGTTCEESGKAFVSWVISPVTLKLLGARFEVFDVAGSSAPVLLGEGNIYVGDPTDEIGCLRTKTH